MVVRYCISNTRATTPHSRNRNVSTALQQEHFLLYCNDHEFHAVSWSLQGGKTGKWMRRRKMSRRYHRRKRRKVTSRPPQKKNQPSAPDGYPQESPRGIIFLFFANKCSYRSYFFALTHRPRTDSLKENNSRVTKRAR